MDGVNLWAVLAASVAMFVVGAIWYMVFFSKLWSQIHGFDKLDKKAQAKMQKEIGPYYGAQLLVTIISAFVLAKLIVLLPDYSAYMLAFWGWLGFVVPATVSGVIFGGIMEGKWVMPKILIQIGESLVHLLVAAWVITLIQ